MKCHDNVVMMSGSEAVHKQMSWTEGCVLTVAASRPGACALDPDEPGRRDEQVG